MKISPDSTPLRFTCRLVRALGSAGHETPARGDGPSARHLAACPACQQFFAAREAWDARLRNAAKTLDASTPAGLEERLLTSVRRARREEAAGRVNPGWTRFLPAAGLSVAACLAVLGYVRWGSADAVREAKAPTPAVAPLQQALPGAGNLWRALQPPAGAILTAAPLQDEVDAIYSDARSALGFLAANFLPAPPPAFTAPAVREDALPTPVRS